MNLVTEIVSVEATFIVVEASSARRGLDYMAIVTLRGIMTANVVYLVPVQWERAIINHVG